MKSPRNYAKHSYQTEVFEKWKSLSNDMNWSYTKGPWYNSDIIKIKHNSWTIILDNYRDSFTGFGIIYNKFTRVRAPIINNNKFCFAVYNRDFFSRVGKFFGLKYAPAGIPEIDRYFIVKTNDGIVMHNILNNNKIRYFLRNNIRINLALKPAEKDWYKSSLPDNTYELYFRVPGFIQDTEYLKYIVNLFDVFLDKLTEHGIASSIADDGIQCA